MTSMGAVKESARGSHLLFREEATGDLSGKVTIMSDMEAKKDPAMGRSEGREIQGEGTACANTLTLSFRSWMDWEEGECVAKM